MRPHPATFHLKSPGYYLKLTAVTLAATIFSTLLLAGFLMSVILTIPLKSTVCCETPARFGADYAPVSFLTTDGLTLRGWYVPPRNGALIILVHSYYGDRRQTLPVAEMLFKHGYGLLMYDQRASGASDGSTRSLGWLDTPDLAQAVNLVVTRQKDLKIGVYGCSMGGAISLAGSVAVPGIGAIASDAPSPLSWDEYRPAFSLADPVSLPVTASYYQFVRLRSGAGSVASAAQAVRALGSRPILFISTGQGGEFARVERLFQAAAGPKAHWNLPNSSHCAGPGTDPAEYEAHLVEFFKTYLLTK
jgi:fermentation-respiration switch protein FrsA (DUF1100 family)